jgi:hypothetical protein
MPRQRKHIKDLPSHCRTLTTVAINTLVGIMTNPQCAEQSRIAAAVKIIEYGHGKTPHNITVTQIDNRQSEKLAEFFGVTINGTAKSIPDKPKQIQ